MAGDGRKGWTDIESAKWFVDHAESTAEFLERLHSSRRLQFEIVRDRIKYLQSVIIIYLIFVKWFFSVISTNIDGFSHLVWSEHRSSIFSCYEGINRVCFHASRKELLRCLNMIYYDNFLVPVFVVPYTLYFDLTLHSVKEGAFVGVKSAISLDIGVRGIMRVHIP